MKRTGKEKGPNREEGALRGFDRFTSALLGAIFRDWARVE